MVNGDQVSQQERGQPVPPAAGTSVPREDPQGQQDPESPLVLMSPPESAGSEIPAEQI